MESHPEILIKEFSDCLRFVSGEVIQDDVDLFGRGCPVNDLRQKGEEVFAGVAPCPPRPGSRASYLTEAASSSPTPTYRRRNQATRSGYSAVSLWRSRPASQDSSPPAMCVTAR